MILPLKWLVAAVLAAVFHELCHYAALRWRGVRVFGLSVGKEGMRMETEEMMAMDMLLCVAAGPLGSLLLVQTVRLFPELALCGLVQGAYNLLPIYPMDGGRIIRSVLEILIPEKQLRVEKGIAMATVSCIFLLALYGYIRLKLGVGVIFAAILILCRALAIKIPCKDGRKRVQ